jgi:hypothetical protein
MNPYLKGVLVFGVPTTVLGFLIGGLFAHQGGPMMYVAIALVPGFALAALSGNDLILLVGGAIAQIAYWIFVVHVYFRWRKSHALDA